MQRYPIRTILFCKVCKSTTPHCIYDEEKKIYKCLICKTIHG